MKTYLFAAVAVILTLVFPSCKKEWKPGIPLAKEKVKIAVIHINDPFSDTYSYSYAHETGIKEMQENIGLENEQIIRKTNVYDGDLLEVEGAMLDSIAEGANIIIATSWGYMDACEKLAAKFPSVIFAHATGNKYNSFNFTNYSIRFYQARYLAGIVAGLQTKTGKIGYVAAMGKNNSEVTGGINAFALGVEEVNPEARVYVRVTFSWYDPMGETDAANALIAAGCDIITQHSNTPYPQMASQRAGVWGIGYGRDMLDDAPDAVLTSVVPRWGALYTRLVGNIIKGTFSPALYFDGLAEGAVDITPLNEELVVPGIETAVETARQRIARGDFNVFNGVLETNDKTFIGEAGKTLSDEVILNGINWYYRNVIE